MQYWFNDLHTCVHGVHLSEACSAGALEEKGGVLKFRENWFVIVKSLNAVWDWMFECSVNSLMHMP